MTGFSIESTLDWNGLIVGSFWFFGIYIDIKESSTEIPIVMGVISQSQACFNLNKI